MDEAFDAAMDELRLSAPAPQHFSRPFVEVFPISGAAVSTLGGFLGTETVSASDRTAARLDELQFDLGEGPCWDAMRTIRPILVADIRDRGRAKHWSAFSPAALAQDVCSIFAFPLLVGTLQIGAVDLYSVARVELDEVQARQAGAMASEVGRQVLRNALAGIADEQEQTASAFSRRLIHQATGVVLAQLDISADDARLMIQGHAFAADQPMMDTARDIIEGRLNFSRGGSGIEASDHEASGDEASE